MRFLLYPPILLAVVLLCLCLTLLPIPLCAAGPASGTQSADTTAFHSGEVFVPGPLRSFLRMAGISQGVSQEEVLPLLAHNVFSIGYQTGRPTEFLVLLRRYVRQAGELSALAGPDNVIRVSNCDEATPLLRVLGYRVRQDCGQSTAALATSDPERAFLTIDSGFPLPELERTLQGGASFVYPFPTSRLPVLFTPAAWTSVSREDRKASGDLVETLTYNPALARLYWALSKTDAETRVALQQSLGLEKLLPLASVLDFYGSHLCIRSGRVIVPGGPAAEIAWKNLVGAGPESPRDFVPRLLAKDRGWLGAYFDALSRTSHAQQAHFTEEQRLKRLYQAFRAPETPSDAAEHSFRPAPGLLLLLTRLRWEPNGDPYIPGDLDTWKQILRQKSEYKAARDWGRRAQHWDRPEQMLEALFAFSRLATDTGPLQSYLMMSELDGRRPPEKRLSRKTVLLLAENYTQFSDWYLIFSEFPDLNDESMARFVNVARAVDKLPNRTLRGNAMGILQANVGLWQILARQEQIANAHLNDSWQGVVGAFANVSSPSQLFDAGRRSLRELSLAATGKPDCSEDEFVDLLAGPRQASPEGQRMHQSVASGIRAVLDGQRLVSIDTLLALGNGLNAMERGIPAGEGLIRLAGELREFEMPRPIFTSSERTQWAAGIYNNRHTDSQMRTDLARVIKGPSSRVQLDEARGQLAPFLRDTLVGLNYAYYEPPGAQVLHHNPLFVRSHDFAGETVQGVERLWQAPHLFGEGAPAGGGAHLVGSLADLPYVLAVVEQDFIVPQNVQALIWRELVPGLLVSATLPRWWNVSPNELHAVTLYQRAGEELLAASVENEELRGKVLSILSDRIDPQGVEQVEKALHAKRLAEILPQVSPADTFYLATEFRRRFPGETVLGGTSAQELESLSRKYPPEVGWERLSEDFGVPHPILTQTYARELLNVRPFPAFDGYSSRLLAETWDSSNLYWARLADEMGYSPVELNHLVPELTRRMIERVFATDFEDWPALLRAMHETGEEFRNGKVALAPTTGAAARP